VPDADIYVTTWFGTKPALRPEVALVAVLNADALLRRPDWRAAESAYQACAAMAEWAGPAESGGRLVIQTAEPTHYAIQAIVRGDYTFFAQRELEPRRELGYPPLVELVRATALGPRRAGLIERVAGAARRRRATVLGPLEVRVARGPGELVEATEVLVKCDDVEPLCDDLRSILASAPQGSSLLIDVDPR
jgi:primosomal protein N' (replication factor Y)